MANDLRAAAVEASLDIAVGAGEWEHSHEAAFAAGVKYATDSLTVEAETYRQMHETAKEMGYPSILEALEAVDSLTARIAQLEAALRPFAEEADKRPRIADTPSIADWPIGGSALTNRDLGRARAALKDGGE